MGINEEKRKSGNEIIFFFPTRHRQSRKRSRIILSPHQAMHQLQSVERNQSSKRSFVATHFFRLNTVNLPQLDAPIFTPSRSQYALCACPSHSPSKSSTFHPSSARPPSRTPPNPSPLSLLSLPHLLPRCCNHQCRGHPYTPLSMTYHPSALSLIPC